MILQAVYISRRPMPAHGSELADILAASRRNNPEIGITGLLAVTPLRYVQILEGPRESVDMLLDFIADDERHGRMQVIDRSDVAERNFGCFAMAELDARHLEAEDLDRRLDRLVDHPDPDAALALVRDLARLKLLIDAA